MASRTSSSIRENPSSWLGRLIAGEIWLRASAAKGPRPEPQDPAGFGCQTHGANILSRLWFHYREIQAMRDSKTFLSAVALVAALVVSALPAAAQTGRIGGQVKDAQSGQPLKGATITAENPQASPSSFTATTDDKGRYSIIGLKTGTWKVTAVAPGLPALVRPGAGPQPRRADASGRLRARRRRVRPHRRARRREHQGAAGRIAEGRSTWRTRASTTRRLPRMKRSWRRRPRSR